MWRSRPTSQKMGGSPGHQYLIHNFETTGIRFSPVAKIVALEERIEATTTPIMKHPVSVTLSWQLSLRLNCSQQGTKTGLFTTQLLYSKVFACDFTLLMFTEQTLFCAGKLLDNKALKQQCVLQPSAFVPESVYTTCVCSTKHCLWLRFDSSEACVYFTQQSIYTTHVDMSKIFHKALTRLRMRVYSATLHTHTHTHTHVKVSTAQLLNL